MTKQTDPTVHLMFARATHFYPGCMIVVKDLPPAVGRRGAVAVEMSDGAGVNGTCVLLQDDTLELNIDSSVTAKGTAIKAKQWTLRCIDEKSALWKVVA
ncbi:hypothetical protein [Caballeronia sp. INDeC2]|uniref:hypothetical protein n=1 Tax=Caballeronia sp. INDeC2 TaxID=2921747 RepID=UPI0020297C1D|nr:hypothetical protein [Caballeronia sp. INDeC2]